MKQPDRPCPATMSALCDKTGMSRQNYYKEREERRREEADEGRVVELARRERGIQPRLGGRKLFHTLKGRLREAGIKLGRDKFFDILRKNGLLIEPVRSAAPKTTDSRHSLPVYRNIVADGLLV